jgi:hypothetical protein
MASGATSRYYIIWVQDLLAEAVQRPAIDAQAGPGDDVDRRGAVEMGAESVVVPLLVVPDRSSLGPRRRQLRVVAVARLLRRFRVPSHHQRGGREPPRTCM